MRIVKYLGTIMPAVIIISCLLALWSARDGMIGWERPALYEVVALSAAAGLWALIHMARHPVNNFPSVFVLLLIYQKAFLVIFWQSAAFITFSAEPQPLAQYEEVVYLFLLASSVCMIAVNLILFFGRTRGWLEQPADPVPCRAFLSRRR